MADKFAVPQEVVTEPQQPQPHHPSTPHSHTRGDGDDDSAHSYVCKFQESSGQWECVQYYKQQILQDVIDGADSADWRATIDQLKDFGVTVYLTEYDSINIDVLRKVVHHVSKSHNDRSKPEHENQRCLLYRDEKGRIYNVVLKNEASGLASNWKSLLISFSGIQAMIAITALTRVFACVPDEGAAYRPGKLVLILGLILFEEISFVGLNCSMFVRGTPSVAAHTLISSFESDWLRKLTIAGLALAGVQTDGSDLQRYGTVTFIAFAVLVLGANLGARAWHFMKWKPMAKEGFFAPFISFLLAALTGFTLPYIGFGKIQAGGKAAVQLVIYNSIIVASMFVISDLDIIQQYLVDGSETCNQDITNIGLGVWFTLTVITCIFAALKIEPPIPHPEDDDHILVEDQTSPVGFKVPNFPDYPIDPSTLERNGFSRCSMSGEVMAGMVVGVLVGVAVACTGLFDLMNNGNDFVDESTGGNV